MKSLAHRIAALVSLSSLLATPAFAGGYGHGNGNHHGYGNYGGWRNSSFYIRSMTFGLEVVEANRRRNELTVRFRADERSLRAANQAGIFPTLNVQAGYQSFQARIDRCDGVVVFSLDRRNDPRDIEISVSGANGRWRIDNVVLGGQVSPRVIVPVAYERGHDRDRDRGHDDRDRNDRDRGHDDRDRDHGHGGNQQPLRWAFQPAVIQACGNAFEGPFNEQQCLQTVDAFAFNPVASIDGCELAMEGDANELACLQTAARSTFDRSQQLNACELAMDGDANELACFAKATTARFEPTQTINACELAFDGDPNELACMDATFRYNWSPVAMINACEQSMDGDPAELACLARY